MSKPETNGNKKRILKNIAMTAILIIAVIACLLLEKYNPSFSWLKVSKLARTNSEITEQKDKFYSHFLDVGQADCTLLKCNDDVVLIDAGDIDDGYTICRYLDSMGVEEIDYFIITHPHTDHIGSADDILKKYKVENVIMPRLSEENIKESVMYDSLSEALNKSGAQLITANAGDAYSLESFDFTLLSPGKEYSGLNDCSVVIKAVFGKISLLYMGDAEQQAEEDMLKSGFDLSADVLKVGHHGSSTSTGRAFLNAVNPQFAVISCGENNEYNHPDIETVLKLKAKGVDFCRTDIYGNIVVVCEKDSFTVNTQR